MEISFSFEEALNWETPVYYELEKDLISQFKEYSEMAAMHQAKNATQKRSNRIVSVW